MYTKPFVALFTQLAVSLVYDLGLNKPVPQHPPALCNLPDRNRGLHSPRSMEERRAVLGCFLITSLYVYFCANILGRLLTFLFRVASFVQKIDALRWTTHLDECLRMLDEKKECSNDEILVQQVRLQFIAEEAARSMWHGRHVSSGNEVDFHAQLENAKASLLANSPKKGE